MTGAVTFVVDLDAAGAPPAADSVRQLLVLLDGLQSENAKLDWRLISISTNSPLQARVEAFDRAGVPASGAEAARAAAAAFEVLEATNDNATAIVRTLSEQSRAQLRAYINPIRQKGGLVRIQVDGLPEKIVTSAGAERAYTALAATKRQRRPEYGSIEGQIIAATTHYNSPALRVRTFLTGDEVLCVFGREAASEIGAEHTIAEVWQGRRVVVGGRITFDAAGSPSVVRATSLRTLGGGEQGAAGEAVWTGEAIAEPWGEVH